MTREQWGRIAIDLPGWPYHAPDDYKQHPLRNRRGIEWIREDVPWGDRVPDVDDQATGGILLYLLGDWAGFVIHSGERGGWIDTYNGVRGAPLFPSLGRACVHHAMTRKTWWPFCGPKFLALNQQTEHQ